MDRWLRKMDHYSPVSLFWAGLAVGFTLAFLLSSRPSTSSSTAAASSTRETLTQTLPLQHAANLKNPRVPVPGLYLRGGGLVQQQVASFFVHPET